MDRSIKLADVVALTEELAERRLRRGQVGTAVECLAPDCLEAESRSPPNCWVTHQSASSQLSAGIW